MTEIFKQGLEQLEMLSSQESTGLVMRDRKSVV